MSDMDKIIKGLEFTKAMITFDPSTGEEIEPGNLNEANKTTYDACVGAIALLEEQEAVVRCKDCKHQEPVKIEVKKINDNGRCGRCPNCLMELNEMDYPNYCGNCGRLVKWE